TAPRWPPTAKKSVPSCRGRPRKLRGPTAKAPPATTPAARTRRRLEERSQDIRTSSPPAAAGVPPPVKPTGAGQTASRNLIEQAACGFARAQSRKRLGGYIFGFS